jgi:hypothetical protein
MRRFAIDQLPPNFIDREPRRLLSFVDTTLIPLHRLSPVDEKVFRAPGATGRALRGAG